LNEEGMMVSSRLRTLGVVIGMVLLGTPFPPRLASVATRPISVAAPLATASTDRAGCVSETGTHGACVDGTALDGASGITLSPDGMNVYAASETSRSVSVFARNLGTGAITQLPGKEGCVSDSGTGGACADGRALVGPRSIVVSPDGKNLYFPSTTSSAIAVFARDRTTGVLRQLVGTRGCVSDGGRNGCALGRALAGARSAAVSPDGTSVYVVSFFSDAVAVFARNRRTGALTQLAGKAGCISDTGNGGACSHGVALNGARSVVVSPDGSNVYVASETSGAVAIFTRNHTTGALTQLRGAAGCVSQTGSGGDCIDATALGGAGGIAISRKGGYLYVASLSSDAVAVFSRGRLSGALRQLPGKTGCVSETGNRGACADGKALDRARYVSISPDGSSVYVAAEASNAVAIFSRDPATGTLTQLAGRAGCLSDTGSSGACADGTALGAARAVSVSSDGKTVYAASFASSAVSIFSRDPVTGALTQL
jgi:6-phosphogluconolactonase (cycloisomerase 2 family)